MENVLRLIRFNPLHPPKMEQYCIVATEADAHLYPAAFRWDSVARCFYRRNDGFAVEPGSDVYWAPVPKIVLFKIENGASTTFDKRVR